MIEIDRGFQGIIVACSLDTQPIFFDCGPVCFPNKTGLYTIYEIKDGTFTKHHSDKPLNPQSNNFKNIIEIENRTIKGNCDSLMAHQLLYINDHIANLVSKYFNTVVIRLKLVFAINNTDFFNHSDQNIQFDREEEEDDEKNIFVLLEGSTVVTSEKLNSNLSSRPSSNYASRSINIDNHSQESSEQNKKTPRSDTSQQIQKSKKENQPEVIIDISDIESEEQQPEDDTFYQIIIAIDNELQRDIDKSRCISGSNNCGPPNFRVKRLTVAFNNLHQLFPYIEVKELRDQIKLRMPHLNEDAFCCIQCYHYYLAFERCYRASKRPDVIRFERRPQLFQPLVKSELCKLAKMPIDSISETKNQAHSFALNIIDSPYHGSVFKIPKPPKAKNKKKNIKVQRNSQSSLSNSRPKTSVPKWVARLTSDEFDVSARKFATRSSLSSLRKYRGADYASVPYYQTPVGYSEFEAPVNYYPMPFDRSKLESDEKRKMMSRKIPSLKNK